MLFRLPHTPSCNADVPLLDGYLLPVTALGQRRPDERCRASKAHGLDERDPPPSRAVRLSSNERVRCGRGSCRRPALSRSGAVVSGDFLQGHRPKRGHWTRHNHSALSNISSGLQTALGPILSRMWLSRFFTRSYTYANPCVGRTPPLENEPAP